MADLDTFLTRHLAAVRLSDDHLDLLCCMHHDEQLMATLGGVRTDEQTRDYLQHNLDHWTRFGFGLWMFRESDSGSFVGRAGLRHVDVGGNDEIELAFAVLPEFQRRGLATEMSAALIGHAFSTFELTELVAFTLTSNAASRRVIQKSGFTYERDITHADRPHVLYRLKKEAREP